MYGHDSDIFKYPYPTIDDHINSVYKLNPFELHKIEQTYSEDQLLCLAKERDCDMATIVQLFALRMERDRLSAVIELMQKEKNRRDFLNPMQAIRRIPWQSVFQYFLIIAAVCFLFFLGALRYQSNSDALDNQYNKGYESGKFSGHDEGYEEGFSDGYSSGYDDGLLKND